MVFQKKFANNPNAMAWLWKDHTSVVEADEITAAARKKKPEYLAKCGGTYSSEWFWAKILRCSRVAPGVFRAAHSWVELADYVPAFLTGTEHPDDFTACVCAAGHKAMYSADWGGYPKKTFLKSIDPKLADVRDSLQKEAKSIDYAVGGLTDEWAEKTGLTAGIPVAAGAFDCHLGGVGVGIAPGTLVKVIGTSTCDIAVAPGKTELPDIPGLCGIVKGSILPGFWGLEAGQSAVGDIFNWFVGYVKPDGLDHATLDKQASKLKPGESGLVALDWNNGNRTVLVDQRLTGLLMGQTLYTTPAEIYRALIEATAFGALTIINRMEEYDVKIKQVVACGGIAEKSAITMQIYADVTGRPVKISRSAQTCALGAAIAGAVVAGKKAGGYNSFKAAQKEMTGLKKKVYTPNKEAHAIYKKLYACYMAMHDALGKPDGSLSHVMKDMLDVRNEVR